MSRILNFAGKAVEKRPAPERNIIPGLELTREGGIVPFPANLWYVGFVPALDRRLWHSLVHPRHTHCFALRPAGREWLVIEPWWARAPLNIISTAQASRFFLWAEQGDMLLAREETPGRSSQLRGVMTCAALLAHMLGRPYHVITPNALFHRLDREPDTLRIDAARYRSTLQDEAPPHSGTLIEARAVNGAA